MWAPTQPSDLHSVNFWFCLSRSGIECTSQVISLFCEWTIKATVIYSYQELKLTTIYHVCELNELNTKVNAEA